MQNIYLLSCFTKKIKRTAYTVGEEIVLPFSGVYRGSQVKSVRLSVSEDFIKPTDKIICICKLRVIKVAGHEILGILCSIKFL